MSRSLLGLKSLSKRASTPNHRVAPRIDPCIIRGESSQACGQTRRFAATAAARRQAHSRDDNEFIDDDEMDNGYGLRRGGVSRRGDGDNSMLHPKARQRADSKPLVDYLQSLFPPLKFPDLVATQALTHISAKEAWAGHNARLSFVGRRVLNSYLLLFVHSATQNLLRNSQDINLDYDLIAYRALYTPFLGEKVGDNWNLNQVMLWTPPVRGSPDSLSDASDSRARTKRMPGFYKVQGTTVEAVMGGIYHQFGGTVAHRAFHTRFLPHLMTKGERFGLHEALHDAALEVLEKMGGTDAQLLSAAESESRSRVPGANSFHSINRRSSDKVASAL